MKFFVVFRPLRIDEDIKKNVLFNSITTVITINIGDTFEQLSAESICESWPSIYFQRKALPRKEKWLEVRTFSHVYNMSMFSVTNIYSKCYMYCQH